LNFSPLSMAIFFQFTNLTVKKYFPSQLAAACSRAELGLPSDWSRVSDWICTDKVLPADCDAKVSKPKPEVLSQSTFQRVDWSAFPRKGIPSRPETRVNVKRLEEIVAMHEHLLLEQEVARAKRALDYLRNGAPALR
jgi:hypothetical protein